MFDPAGFNNNIKASAVVDSAQPLRMAALRVIKSLDHSKLNLGASPIDDVSSLIIKPLSSKANPEHFIDNDPFGFGPEYLINSDGSLQVFEGLRSMRPWTIEEFDLLADSGYIDYKRDYIVVVIPEGLGASAEIGQLLAMTSTIADIVGIVSFISLLSPKIFGFISKWYFDRPARKLVEQWLNQGIKYPEDLRKWIDKKGEWTLPEVKTRLVINEQYAVKLLTALGLEPVDDSWRLTQSKESIRKRRGWRDNERKWQKLLSQSQ